jgi:hypothetical protein
MFATRILKVRQLVKTSLPVRIMFLFSHSFINCTRSFENFHAVENYHLSFINNQYWRHVDHRVAHEWGRDCPTCGAHFDGPNVDWLLIQHNTQYHGAYDQDKKMEQKKK